MNPSTLEEIEQSLDAFLWPDPDPRQRATRARILTAATELFVRYGYRKTSIEEVARGAGIAKGTVYLYYRNKSELLFHAVALEKQAGLEDLRSLLDPKLGARDGLRALIAGGLMMSRRQPLLTRLSGGDNEIALAIGDSDTSVLTQVNELQSEFMIRLLREAADGTWSESLLIERAQVLIDLLFAVMTGGRWVKQGSSLEACANIVASTIVDGILAEPTPAVVRIERTEGTQSIQQGVL